MSYDLSDARIEAHRAFEAIWKGGDKSCKEAYLWLAEQLGIPECECRMQYFNIDMCERVRRTCDRYTFKRTTA